MKNTRSFITGFLLAIALVVTVQVSAGVTGWKTDVVTAFTNNFTAGQRTTIASSFVTAYQSEWDARVAAGTVDNAANRGQFVADKIAEYVQNIVRAEQYKASVNAVPFPTPLPDTE